MGWVLKQADSTRLDTTRNIRYSGITLVGVNTIRYYKYLHNHV